MKRFLIACLFVPALAIAANDKPLDLDKVVSQQKQIRSDVLSSNGKYRGLTSTKQTELLQRQDGLLRMLEGKRTSEDLSEEERIAAFNELEWIEGIVNKEESDRLICRRERTVGSNRVTRVCRTAEQMEAQRESARDSLADDQMRR